MSTSVVERLDMSRYRVYANGVGRKQKMERKGGDGEDGKVVIDRKIG